VQIPEVIPAQEKLALGYVRIMVRRCI